ncbi:hypothetical protein V8N76_004540 [Salmonella enterica]
MIERITITITATNDDGQEVELLRSVEKVTQRNETTLDHHIDIEMLEADSALQIIRGSLANMLRSVNEATSGTPKDATIN